MCNLNILRLCQLYFNKAEKNIIKQAAAERNLILYILPFVTLPPQYSPGVASDQIFLSSLRPEYPPAHVHLDLTIAQTLQDRCVPNVTAHLLSSQICSYSLPHHKTWNVGVTLPFPSFKDPTDRHVLIKSIVFKSFFKAKSIFPRVHHHYHCQNHLFPRPLRQPTKPPLPPAFPCQSFPTRLPEWFF